MSMGKSFFDQYSVFCVFGSVVGCVVVPLIAQSVECVIFSALVISLTAATHLNKKTNGDSNGKVNSFRDNEKRRVRDTNLHGNSRRRKERPQPCTRSLVHHQVEYTVEEQFQQLVKEEDLIDTEEQRSNMKKAKKARKREERLQRKEMKNKESSEERKHGQGKTTDDQKTRHHHQNSNSTARIHTSASSKDTTSRERSGKEGGGSKRFCSRPPRLDTLLRGNTMDTNNNNNNNNNKRKQQQGTSSSRCSRKPSSPLPVPLCLSTRSGLSASNSSLSSIGSSTIDHHESSSPPPSSVWKLPPQNIDPVWLPGGTEDMRSHKPVVGKQHRKRPAEHTDYTKQQNITQRDTDKAVVPSSRVEPGRYSSLFCGATQADKEPTDTGTSSGHMESVGEYSLFGPTRLDSVLYQTPSLFIK